MERQLTIASWDAEEAYLSRHKAALQKHCQVLGDVSFKEVKAITSEAIGSADMLMISGFHVGDKDLGSWLYSVERKMIANASIWTPALIISNHDFKVQRDLLKNVWQSNWYFDLIHPDHFDSLPLRIANLMRIHDHIKELNNYQEQIATLQEQVEVLEGELVKLKGQS